MDLIQEATKGFLSFSSDAIIILAIIAIGSAYAYFMGKGRGISLLLSFFPTALIFLYFPFLKTSEVILQIVVFLVILFAINTVMNRFISSNFPYSKIRTIFEAIVIGILLGGFLLLTSYHLINIDSLYNFSSWTDALFAKNTLFYWLIAPFIGMFLLKKY